MTFTSELAHPSTGTLAQPISYADFRVEYADQHAEWENGEAIIIMNNTLHQNLLVFLIKLLGFYVELKNVGKIFPAGLQMDLGDDFPHREPDLMIILNAHLDRVEATRINGAADIAIEIVSPESHDRDYGKKFTEYEAGGVTEYWIIDPQREQFDLYHRHEDGYYRRLNLTPTGQLQSRVLPDFRLDPQILWQAELPEGAALLTLIQTLAQG